MKIVILGSGGAGGYFGGRLAAAGNDVTFVARGEQLAALRRNGLKIIRSRGNLDIPQIKTAETVGETETADLVLVSVKLWDTEEIAADLAPTAKSGAAIISFQNGVQKDDLLRQYVPPASLIGGVCYIAAAISEPGVIRHVGTLQQLVFGEYGAPTSTRTEAFLAACQKAGVDAEISMQAAATPSSDEIWRGLGLLGVHGLLGSMLQEGMPEGFRHPPRHRRPRNMDAGCLTARDSGDRSMHRCRHRRNTVPPRRTAAVP